MKDYLFNFHFSPHLAPPSEVIFCQSKSKSVPRGWREANKLCSYAVLLDMLGLFLLRSYVLVIFSFLSKLPLIRTKYLCRTRNVYREQRGRYQVSFPRENKLFYYINTNEIPRELSRENIFTREKITVAMVT